MSRTLQLFVILAVMAASPVSLFSRGLGAQNWKRCRIGASSSSAVPMKKFVSPQANFVVYMPRDWTIREAARGKHRTLTLASRDGKVMAEATYGFSPVGNDAVAIAKSFAHEIGRRHRDLRLSNCRLHCQGGKIVFDGRYTDRARGTRQFRCWVTSTQREFLCSRIEAPAGKLDQHKRTLLTVLSNIRMTKGAFRSGSAAVDTANLVRRRLRDGSSSFLMPRTWSVRELGRGQFIAGNPRDGSSFIVASVDVMEPRMRVNYPGAVVAPFLPPHRALKLLAGRQGLVTNMRFEKVIPRTDLARQLAQVYTTGPVKVEEFVYTGISKGRKIKGYTFGMCFGSRLGTNWNFRHMSVGAAANRFDAMVPVYIAMLSSFKINEDWARKYVAQGISRLRSLQRQTNALVQRNAQEIRQTMQAAYEERQRSQDYIDYQRTSYIRGTQDWVSQMEGGTIYHTDRWGTRNTTTGAYYEGQPYNYFNYRGRNPRYNEDMDPINSRRLWEQHIAGR